MSFLSTLLCCFDAEDSHKRENNHNNNSRPKPRLTKTQSNLQKALAHSNSNLNSNPNTPFLKPQSSALCSKSSNMDTKNSNNNSNKISSNSGNTAITTNITNNSKTGGLIINSANGSNLVPATVTDLQNSNKNNNTDILNSTDYKEIEIIDEISNSKDSTDSSKNEDDAIQIHENQTQGTDDTLIQNFNLNQIQNQAQNLNLNQNQVQNQNQNQDQDQIQVQNQDQIQGQDQIQIQDQNETRDGDGNGNEMSTHTDSNPISNFNPNDMTATTTFDYEELLYDQQFGIDLTEILPDQTVAPSGWLLDKQPESLKGKKCLVLDLDETLVHSSFKYVRQCDFVIPVEIENQIHNVYVIKRPGVDRFLERVGQLFEVVVFTASVSRYGDPLLNILDSSKSIHHRLFRDSCYNYQGNYIKNLSQMGRPLQDLIIIDNSPASYVFHPQHAVPISSWFSDSHDCELTDLLPFLEDLASSEVDDVRLALDINM